MTVPLEVLRAPIGPPDSTDPVAVADLLALADADGPCASMVVPVHAHGPETVQGARRLSKMAKQLVPLLGDAGFDDRAIHKFLSPVRALVADAGFWQHQAQSLVLFRTPRWTWRWRLDQELPEECVLAASARVRLLLPALGAERFHVLAISQNHVRVLSVSGSTVERTNLPDLPRSLRDALRLDVHDKNLGFHSTGSQLHRHGSGIGAEVEKEKLRRYLQILDRALVSATGSWRTPVVLACTDECAAMYRGLSKLDHLTAEHVPGSPDRVTDAELVARAAPIAARTGRAAVVDGRDGAMFREMDGTGRVVRDLGDALAAVDEGSVEVLFVTDGPPIWGSVSAGVIVESGRDRPTVLDEDLLGRCVTGTLRHGGRVHLVSDGALGEGTRIAALTRY
jgi:hypothetical protein